jgi:hypothetical protein
MKKTITFLSLLLITCLCSAKTEYKTICLERNNYEEPIVSLQNRFNIEINNEIKNGFKPIGNAQVSVGKTFNVICQTMVKETKK